MWNERDIASRLPLFLSTGLFERLFACGGQRCLGDDECSYEAVPRARHAVLGAGRKTNAGSRKLYRRRVRLNCFGVRARRAGALRPVLTAHDDTKIVALLCDPRYGSPAPPVNKVMCVLAYVGISWSEGAGRSAGAVPPPTPPSADTRTTDLLRKRPLSLTMPSRASHRTDRGTRSGRICL